MANSATSGRKDRWRLKKDVTLGALLHLTLLLVLMATTWINLQKELALIRHDLDRLLHSHTTIQEHIETISRESQVYEYRLQQLEQELNKNADLGKSEDRNDDGEEDSIRTRLSGSIEHLDRVRHVAVRPERDSETTELPTPAHHRSGGPTRPSGRRRRTAANAHPSGRPTESGHHRLLRIASGDAPDRDHR